MNIQYSTVVVMAEDNLFFYSDEGKVVSFIRPPPFTA
jgi:hypothetical protein